MSSVSKPRVRHNRHKQGLNLTLEKLSADFRLVFSLVKLYGANLELTKEIKSRLLVIPTLDVRINGKRSPLMVAVAQTTASLYKCFCGEIRRISYPER